MALAGLGACGSETDGGGGNSGGATSSGTGGTGNTVVGGGGSGGQGCDPDELCDGIDNDCDGDIDEGCDCIEGDTQDCYSGDPDLLGIGACQSGLETCDLYGVFGSCEGEVVPGEEICDQLGYVEHVIDLSAWDDGGSHTILFWSEVFGQGPPATSITNFFVDDVSVDVCIP